VPQSGFARLFPAHQNPAFSAQIDGGHSDNWNNAIAALGYFPALVRENPRLCARAPGQALWAVGPTEHSFLAPNHRRMLIIGHQLENADWIRFSDTKPVNKKKYGLT
jgi:hypothetical protein